MDTDKKLDKIIALLELIIENQQGHDERFDELQEQVADRALPGSGFGIVDTED